MNLAIQSRFDVFIIELFLPLLSESDGGKDLVSSSITSSCYKEKTAIQRDYNLDILPYLIVCPLVTVQQHKSVCTPTTYYLIPQTLMKLIINGQGTGQGTFNFIRKLHFSILSLNTTDYELQFITFDHVVDDIMYQEKTIICTFTAALRYMLQVELYMFINKFTEHSVTWLVRIDTRPHLHKLDKILHTITRLVEECNQIQARYIISVFDKKN